MSYLTWQRSVRKKEVKHKITILETSMLSFQPALLPARTHLCEAKYIMITIMSSVLPYYVGLMCFPIYAMNHFT